LIKYVKSFRCDIYYLYQGYSEEIFLLDKVITVELLINRFSNVLKKLNYLLII